MKRRSLATLGLLLLCSATGAAAPAPGTPGPAALTGTSAATGPGPRPLAYVDGVPDTGQFLPDTATLGRVDGRVFSVWEFRQYWFASLYEYRPEPDSLGRLEFLNAMVNKEVLASLARRVNRPLTFEDRSVLRAHTQRALSNVVFQRLVADSVEITEEELRHAWAQGNYELRLQHIVTAERATAERARTEAAQGRIAWPVAVKRYSIATQDAGPDGELGWVSRRSLTPAVALGVFDLEDGQISDVFLDGQGFQVVRVTGRRPTRQPPFEKMRRYLVDDLRPLKIQHRVRMVRDQLRQRVGLVYDSTNITRAADRFGQMPATRTDAEGKVVLDLTRAVPEFAPADTALVLCRWRDGGFTLGAFVAAYNAMPTLLRSPVGTFEAFRWTLDSFVLEPYMARLGAERGLDQDPLAHALVEKKREELMVEHLFRDSVQSRVRITPAERQRYYQENMSEFRSLPRVRFAVIERDSSAAADSVADRLRRGETAADLLRADSLAGRISGALHDRREHESFLFRDQILRMAPGEVRVVGPSETGSYLALQKLGRDPGRQLGYDEVAEIVAESLQNIKAEQILKDLLARHRRRHTIVLHPERLMSVRLADPMLD